MGRRWDTFNDRPEVLFATVDPGDSPNEDTFFAVMAARRQKIACDMDWEGRSLKGQLRRANKLEVPFVVLLGSEEFEQGSATIRNMETGKQWSVPLIDLPFHLERELEHYAPPHWVMEEL